MYGSKFYYNEQNEHLFVNYQCKKKKNVNLLSTMHNAPSTDNTEKKKPLVIHFYNKNKVGLMFSIKWPDNIRRILQAGNGH